MIDIKQKESESTPEKKLGEQAAAAETGTETGKKQSLEHVQSTQSKGEKLFTWGVYSGLNYWFNLASSIVMADYFCNKGGQKYIEKGANGIANMFAKNNPTRHAKVFGHSKTALRTLTLLSGGWALVVPIKLLEDNKRSVVHWLNEKMGVDQTAPDGHKMTPDEIYIEQEQPKQSWLNVILRRTLATAAVMGTGHALNELARDRKATEAFKLSNPESKDDPHGGKSRVEKWVVDTVNKGLDGVGATSLTKNKTGIFQRYLSLAALDTIFTKITAVIMYATNGSKKAHMPKEISDDADPLVTATPLNHLHSTPQPVHQHEHQAPAAEASKPGFSEKVAAQKAESGKAITTPSSKKTIEKSENYTTLAEKSDASPSLAV